MKIEYRLIGILILSYSIISCSLITSELNLNKSEDKGTALAAKMVLVKAEEIDAAPLRIKVLDDVIVLSGFVETDEEKQAAERIIHEQFGEFTVSNEIRVR